MDRFDFSLNNKLVRAWMLIMLPVIALAAILYWVVPADLYFVPHLLLIVATSGFFIYSLLRKKRK
ncbi:hypothetical protein [Bacillus infantis]|uniref:Uncharacterized protein n=1 Tax=Bacillus infantis TaxID=324767 RepID=A0A5D4RKI2_9BACI|nr:hypothetical protein [Bacillus infantis]TYS51965.1 hypothetical protein FZD51_00490 [Bacillus infantis]